MTTDAIKLIKRYPHTVSDLMKLKLGQSSFQMWRSLRADIRNGGASYWEEVWCFADEIYTKLDNLSYDFDPDTFRQYWQTRMALRSQFNAEWKRSSDANPQ